jgi:cellulose synthase/poly-beta-1,6-N-acetylglucosamine synthase-like glycosyltransferase
MVMLPHLLATLYALSISGMAIFAFHKFKMMGLYLRARRSPPLPPAAPGADAPRVCVQCPVYNEPGMIEGLLAAVAALRWPEGRLEIQLLDDSTDETSAFAARWLAAHPTEAARIRHLRRSERAGYKAGALAHGMACSGAEFFAIFDADFRPRANFLEALMPHFADPGVGLVQARWEFANRRASLLTRFQAAFLDAHFVVEQSARHTAGFFFNFNGTAGIWRRAAIEQAGGWTSDTVTEDLDASYRAQLRGWRFVYRPDHPVDSELPESVAAFKTQQHRWTKGGIQVMRKQLAGILRSPISARRKREAAWHLLVGFIHPLLVLFSLVFVPYLLLGPPRAGAWAWLHPAAIAAAFFAAVGSYLFSRYFRERNWRAALRVALASPLLLSFGLGMSVVNTLAVIEGLWRRGGEFVRTPKSGLRPGSAARAGRRRGAWRFVGITAAETALGTLMACGAIHFTRAGEAGLAVLLGLKAGGFLGLAAVSLAERLPRARLS